MTPAGTNPKIEELRFKVKTDPKSRLFYPLAEELRKVGQPAEAEAVLRSGLSSHPTYLSAWVVLGRVLREQQKHGDAVEALTKALELDRGNVVAARLLAESYLALGEKVEAIKKYKLVHALLPGDDEIEATIHRLEVELNSAPAKSVALSAPPVDDLSAPATDGEAAEADVFETTYSRLQREAKLEVETGDVEPMAATHAESPFEDPGTDAGYSADAFEVENPRGIHLAAAPLEADLPSPFPPPALPAETSPAASPEQTDDAEMYEPAGGIAPGFIQGSFNANVAPPPLDEDVFARTITMADLYASQGLYDEARDIYEDILARDPDNARVRAKLDDLERAAAAPAPPEGLTEADEDATLELRSGMTYTPSPQTAEPEAEPEPPLFTPPPAFDEPVFEPEPEARHVPAPHAEPVAAARAAHASSSRPEVEKLQSWLAKVKRPGAGGV